MFQFSYFFLFVAFGFGSGYANPDIPGDDPNPMSPFFLPMSIIGVLLIIWSFFTFGIFWGIVSALEFWLGYFLGRTINT